MAPCLSVPETFWCLGWSQSLAFPTHVRRSVAYDFVAPSMAPNEQQSTHTTCIGDHKVGQSGVERTFTSQPRKDEFHAQSIVEVLGSCLFMRTCASCAGTGFVSRLKRCGVNEPHLLGPRSFTSFSSLASVRKETFNGSPA